MRNNAANPIISSIMTHHTIFIALFEKIFSKLTLWQIRSALSDQIIHMELPSAFSDTVKCHPRMLIPEALVLVVRVKYYRKHSFLGKGMLLAIGSSLPRRSLSSLVHFPPPVQSS